MVIEMDYASRFPENIVLISIVVSSWLFFAAIFLSRRKLPKTTVEKRAPKSRLGLLLQVVSFVIVWQSWTWRFIPLFQPPFIIRVITAVVTIALAVGSTVMALMAVKALGKQWSVAAQVVEGHKLITGGPYRLVRNPIYAGMLGMLIATGLARGQWPGLPIAVVIYLVGNSIRVKSEEKLLREEFGVEFEEYAQRVPAIFPRIF